MEPTLQERRKGEWGREKVGNDQGWKRRTGRRTEGEEGSKGGEGCGKERMPARR